MELFDFEEPKPKLFERDPQTQLVCRLRKTKPQQEILEFCYKHRHRLAKRHRAEIGSKLGLSETQIYKWIWEREQKEYRQGNYTPLWIISQYNLIFLYILSLTHYSLPLSIRPLSLGFHQRCAISSQSRRILRRSRDPIYSPLFLYFFNFLIDFRMQRFQSRIQIFNIHLHFKAPAYHQPACFSRPSSKITILNLYLILPSACS